MTVWCLGLSKDSQLIGVARNRPSPPNNECKNIEGNCGCIHAEEALLLKLNTQQKAQIDHVLLSHSPCIHCALVLSQKLPKLKAVYYREPYRKTQGIKHLISKGIHVEQVEWIGTNYRSLDR